MGALGKTDADVAIAMAAFGVGSMAAALAMPRLLEHLGDRAVMLPAAGAMAVLLLGFAAVIGSVAAALLWPLLLVVWSLMGAAYSAAQVPTGRLLRRSVHEQDRPSIFAAQFALSHACWLVTYPLAGWLGSAAGMPVTLIVLGILAVLGTMLAMVLWPSDDPEIVAHEHADLAPDHPHLADGEQRHGARHAHAFVIDDLHPRWPSAVR